MKTKMKYNLPVDKTKIKNIYLSKSRAHKIYKNSVDFIIPVGTPIKAAADGIVTDVKDDSNISNVTRKYELWENFIEIRHSDEYSYYGHLKKGGSLVKIGDKVKAGQIIGYSGKTGWMANIKEPHLHFMVGKYDYKTLKITFQLKDMKFIQKNLIKP